MVITEVRIKLVAENNERLMAFCSLTLDNAFVIRDLKIIEGTKGLFVAMPSRKLTDRCGRCGCKNHLRSRYCNGCGGHLDENRAPRDHDGRAKLHADIAHPINSSCREVMQVAIIKAYQDERERAKLPGYVCTYDDYDGGDFDYDHAPSYAGAVAGNHRPGYRAHGGHQPVTRGTHIAQEKGVGAAKKSDEFGAGM
ncbi:MAG TPA: SpoVG family protein [Gemmataceae bacterium]|jgi:stage V sporulation protein G|nr:SpoVG family protein [Gemmataceae bacterium]